ADIRLGMTLELAPTLGALIAALMAAHIGRRTLAIMFACFLAYSSASMVRKAWYSRKQDEEEPVHDYTVRNYPLGMLASLIAGGFSGLLGIGGGAIKVPGMFLFLQGAVGWGATASNFIFGLNTGSRGGVILGAGSGYIGVSAEM